MRVRPCDHEARSNVCSDNQGTCREYQKALERQYKIIAAAFHRIVGSESGSLAQRERALRQARLPVNLGGMGLTSMESIRAAAWVGWHMGARVGTDTRVV